MNCKVFHGTPKQGLKILNPNMGKHGFVFASTDIIVSSFFVGRFGGDYACTIHNPLNGIFSIVERYPGALEDRYDHPGSIYTLDGTNFFESDGWKFEVKSNCSNMVIHEEIISNGLEHLFLLQDMEKIKLYRYPDRPFFVPQDDEDLLRKSSDFISVVGFDNVMAQLKRFHPNLYERALKSNLRS